MSAQVSRRSIQFKATSDNTERSPTGSDRLLLCVCVADWYIFSDRRSVKLKRFPFRFWWVAIAACSLVGIQTRIYIFEHWTGAWRAHCPSVSHTLNSCWMLLDGQHGRGTAAQRALQLHLQQTVWKIRWCYTAVVFIILSWSARISLVRKFPQGEASRWVLNMEKQTVFTQPV